MTEVINNQLIMSDGFVLTIGDVVQIRSGGQQMTVVAFIEETDQWVVRCVWWSDKIEGVKYAMISPLFLRRLTD